MSSTTGSTDPAVANIGLNSVHNVSVSSAVHWTDFILGTVYPVSLLRVNGINIPFPFLLA